MARWYPGYPGYPKLETREAIQPVTQLQVAKRENAFLCLYFVDAKDAAKLARDVN